MDSFSGKESNRFKMSDIESGVQFTRPDPFQEAFIDLGDILTLTHRLNLNFPDFLNFPSLNFTINHTDIHQILIVFIYNNFDYKIYGSNKSELIKTLRTVTS